MSRHALLTTKLQGPLDAIQACSDIIEGNYASMQQGRNREDVDIVELMARIHTDLEILANRQRCV